MDPPSRDEMLQLVRDLGAQLAWQRDAGLLEVPAHGTLPVAPALPPSPPIVAGSTSVGAVNTASVAVVILPDIVSVEPAAMAVAPTPTREPHFVEGGPSMLRVIQDEVRACHRCKLASTRTQTVFARGNPGARVCFIGEGPGAEEDRTGLPFVGAAGQLLDRIIAAMRLTEEQVYIANVVKCRPPNNRVPDHEEMSACTPFLLRQMEVVKPDVIVALGKTATAFLLESNASLSTMRGRWHSWKGVPVMPTWHPSYVLRVREEPRSTARAEVWSDMKLVLERLGLPVPAPRG